MGPGLTALNDLVINRLVEMSMNGIYFIRYDTIYELDNVHKKSGPRP
jgi:hypothetical protein